MGWSLRSLITQTLLWFYDSMFSIYFLLSIYFLTSKRQDSNPCTKPILVHTNHCQSQCTWRSCARCGSRSAGPAPCSSPCLLVCLSSCISGQCCSGQLQSPSHANEKIKQIEILKPKLGSCHNSRQTMSGTLGFFVGNWISMAINRIFGDQNSKVKE